MKKKIIHIFLAVTLIVAAFSIGRMTTQQTIKAENAIDYESSCNFAENIVDWNTGGNELSIMMTDGYELYAYKSENIYDNIRMFVPIK